MHTYSCVCACIYLAAETAWRQWAAVEPGLVSGDWGYVVAEAAASGSAAAGRPTAYCLTAVNPKIETDNRENEKVLVYVYVTYILLFAAVITSVLRAILSWLSLKRTIPKWFLSILERIIATKTFLSYSIWPTDILFWQSVFLQICQDSGALGRVVGNCQLSCPGLSLLPVRSPVGKGTRSKILAKSIQTATNVFHI